MKHLQILFLSIVLALGAAYSVSAVAARGGHGGAHSSGHSGGHSGWHGHGSAHFGVFVGPGWYGPYYPYYYPPYYYPPYYYSPYYYPPVSMPPPTYIERAPAIVPGYWYYCGESQAYYPTVGECPEGWQQVAPQPAR